MRTLVHLSDLHFGHVNHALLAPLARCVAQARPDLVVVSGDLTQRARAAEFREARRFLDTLPSPRLVVPGNHDVPLYNLFTRFFQPLAKYRRIITNDLEPVHLDDEIAVVGINTARSLAFKGGRIAEAQIARVRERLCALDARIVKIIVTHHPFDLPEHFLEDDLVGRAALAMKAFAACGADLLLAGHFHISHAGDTAARYRIPGFSALVVQAGTATSTRGRGESNSFNVIRVAAAEIHIERVTWMPEANDFRVSATESYKRAEDRWVQEGADGI
jgi:3',5'-cyclic AMP phosphodiesterase CpdA